VRHILIILSFLLLSSFLTSCEKEETLYKWETSSGSEWKTMGDEKTHPTYEGEVLVLSGIIGDYVMEGFGSMTYPYGGKSIIGEWKEGKEWNTKHTKKDGTLIGNFENGKWIIKWGVLCHQRYIGEWGWYESCFEGDGKFEGEIVNGVPNGEGTQTWSNGDKYIGGWKNGKQHGQGTLTWSKGSKYIGGWKEGERNGQGTMTHSDGGKYVGEYKDGKQNGQGTETYPSGSKYVGEWKDGKRHGQGSRSWSDGLEWVGEWRDNYKWKGIMFDKEGNVSWKIDRDSE